MLLGKDQTASRRRPRRRRAAMILRPPTVLMRLRKPCVFALLRRFGWYVRFMELLCFGPLNTQDNRREYIRSPRDHPAPEDRAKRSPTHPSARARSMGKCCKTSANCDKPECSACERASSWRDRRGISGTCAARFSSCYPQVVDKFVDNHVNILQNHNLFPNAIALWRGVR